MDESTEPRKTSRSLPVVIAALVVVAIVIAAVLLLRRPPAETAAATPAPTPPALATPAPEVPPQLVGVTLPESDPAVRDLAGTLSSDPRLGTWLQHQDLVRRFVAAASTVAEGKSPRQQLEFLKPDKHFKVQKKNSEPYLDPASYHRYDAVASVFASLDPAKTAETYGQAKTLVDAAWAEIGPPGETFDTVLRAAIRELLSAPVVTGPIPLRQKVVTFAFADPDLEGLSDVQKQLIRMGPENQRKIQQQLRAVAHALGIPPQDLPVAREVTATPE